MSRVPKTIAGFNSYIRLTDDYLTAPAPPPANTNWARLGLAQEDSDNWHAYRQSWDTLYTKYSNPATKTKIVNAEVAEAMESFRVFAQPLIDIIAASKNATQQDAETFNFKIGHHEPTHPTMPIQDVCFVSLVTLGGTMVKFACRHEVNGRRPGLPDEANSVMLAYKIGDTPPASPLDNTEMMIVSRASDVKEMGIENRGKRLYIFARWYNTSYPEFAGQWSEMQSVSL